MENRPEFFPVVWAAQRTGLFYTADRVNSVIPLVIQVRSPVNRERLSRRADGRFI